MVSRKIVFYRWSSAEDQNRFSPHESAALLQSKIAGDESKAMLVDQDSTTAVRLLTLGTKTEPTTLQVLAVRSSNDQPVQWRPGQTIRSLLIEDGNFTADVSHVCLWPDGYAAQDWHSHAPSMNRLARYLRDRVHARVMFNLLYRPDMVAMLKRLRGHLRTVEVGLTSPEYADADRPGTLGTLFPAVYGHRTPSVSVRFGMGRYGRRDRYIDEQTEETVFMLAENAQDMVDKMIVSGFDPEIGRTITVNLLKERIGEEVAVTSNPQAATLPDESGIFDEIAKARTKLEEQGRLAGAVEAQSIRPR